MGFSTTGTIIALSLLLPSLLMLVLPPQNKPKLNKPNILFVIIENIGRVACVAILVLSQPSFQGKGINAWFALMSLSTVMYYVLWIRYILKDSEFYLFIKPLGPIPVPMAVFPALAFAFAGVWMNSILMFSAACVFAVGHVINWLDVRMQVSGMPEFSQQFAKKKEKTSVKGLQNSQQAGRAEKQSDFLKTDNDALEKPKNRKAAQEYNKTEKTLDKEPVKKTVEKQKNQAAPKQQKPEYKESGKELKKEPRKDIKQEPEKQPKKVRKITPEEREALKIAEELEQTEQTQKQDIDKDIDELLKDVFSDDE